MSNLQVRTDSECYTKDMEGLLTSWNTEDVLQRFLDKKMDELFPIIVGHDISKPKTEWQPDGTFHMLRKKRMAHYSPKTNNSPAKIILYTKAVINRKIAQYTLAHELIHFWQFNIILFTPIVDFPKEVKEISESCFRHKDEKAQWLEDHDHVFVMRAFELSKKLKCNLKDILFPEQLLKWKRKSKDNGE